MPTATLIWRFSDGKRGHDNQSLGLAEALARSASVQTRDLAVTRRGFSGALAAVPRAGTCAAPALVIGAGHGTHLALIVAARRHRARSIVLMKPSLPRALFDLCIIPAHDDIHGAKNVLCSVGALNRMRPCSGRDPSLGLVLVGGPSRHHRWSDDHLLGQIAALVAAEPTVRWHAAGSRRTPAHTLARLEAVPGLRVSSFDETAADWLPRELPRAGRAWVSEDSVSMAYEAASAGVPTGILAVPRAGPSRAQRAVDQLVELGYASTMAQWRSDRRLVAPPRPLAEADRCAGWILERWPIPA